MCTYTYRRGSNQRPSQQSRPQTTNWPYLVVKTDFRFSQPDLANGCKHTHTLSISRGLSRTFLPSLDCHLHVVLHPSRAAELRILLGAKVQVTCMTFLWDVILTNFHSQDRCDARALHHLKIDVPVAQGVATDLVVS